METFDLDKLLSFIHQSPIVVAIGFIASVLTIIAFFKTRAWIKNTVISQQKTNVNGPQVAQPNAEIKNQNISGNHIHNGPNYGSLYQGPTTINQHGVPNEVYAERVAEYEKRLFSQKLEFERQLNIFSETHVNERQILQNKIKVLEIKLAHPEQSFNALQSQLDELTLNIKQLEGQIPSNQIEKAKLLIDKRKVDEAEGFLDEIYEQQIASAHIAAYQSAQLAEERLDWQKALLKYQQALDLDKSNLKYMKETANMALLLGEFSISRELYLKVLSIKNIQAKPHPGDIAYIDNKLAQIASAQGDYEEAIAKYKSALNLREKTYGSSNHEVLETLNNLAGVYEQVGDYKRAGELYIRALETAEKTLGKTSNFVATVSNNLGLLYKTLGLLEKALPLFQTALESIERNLGPNHPDTATALNNLALQLSEIGRVFEALPLYDRALNIRETVLGKEHPEVAITLNNIALCYRKLGEVEKSISFYERALAIQEKKLTLNNPNIAITLNNIALVYQDKGLYSDAITIYQRALSISKSAFGASHPTVATILNNLAGLYRDSDNLEEAVQLYEEAIRILEINFHAENPQLRAAKRNYQICLMKTKKVV